MSKGAWREMRPAHLREPAGAEYVEVMFLESARIYRLLKKNPKFGEIGRRLREGVGKRRALRVFLDVPEGGVIEDVQPAG